MVSGQVLAEILRNAGALLALALLFDVAAPRLSVRSPGYRSAVAGIAVGLLGIVVMAAPAQLQSGLMFDARSVLLAVSGLVLGAGATAIAMAITIAYRIQIGGAGAATGVLVILMSGLTGIAWRWWRRGRIEEIRAVELYIMGLVVHVAMLALMLTLPGDVAGGVITSIALPVLAVFPLATAALGLFMISRLKRQRLDARLKESEARYRSIFENNHAVMLVIDPADGRIVDANPAAARFYGWSREELTGRPISEINVLPEEEILAEMARARDTDRTFFRFRHRLASGDIRDVEVMSGGVAVEGRPLLYSIVHDVTAERLAMDSLRLRSAALDAAANAIMITDREGTIEWVNRAFCSLYGYEAHEVVGRNPREVVRSGVQGPEFYRDLWATLMTGETWSGRITNRRRDGSLVEEDLSITPVHNGEGEIAHFIAVKQDLTGWRALEQRLALAQKLESVGQLAGGVAHDFNNLLTVVNGTLDLVLGDLADDHAIRADLEEVRRSGERASGLTRQLLAFSRRQVLRKESVNLNEMVAEMESMLRRLIGEDIRITTEFAARSTLVFADRGQLEQVLVNLVVNARDAMPTGGTLSITTANLSPPGARHASPGEAPEPTHIRLTVRDTGMGMEAAVQSRIFDPFFTTKEVGKGTGLGLATVHGIVTQSGGEIAVESEPGRGTVFEIVLPLDTSPGPVPVAEHDHSTVTTGSETILVVEDEEAIRNLVARILGRAGYTVLTAATGAEAIERLSTYPGGVALLFTDVVMPGMSGPELLVRARSIHPAVKALFASGYPGETLTEHGVTVDEHNFLEKPYTVGGLTDMVRNVLDEGTNAT